VSWNGDILLDQTNLGKLGWTNIQLTATASAAASTLQFGYRNDYSYFGLDDISVTVAGSAPTQPQIATVSVAGTNLVLNCGSGTSGQTYYVLMSTNLLKPISQWVPVATNAAASAGDFSITATNAVDPKAPQRFYILELQ
jgi:hypothetical protein